jgi:acetamidase/formamidase
MALWERSGKTLLNKERPALHTVREDQYHHFWDNSVPPVLTVRPNEPVTLQTRDAGHNQIQPGDGVEAVGILLPHNLFDA